MFTFLLVLPAALSPLPPPPVSPVQDADELYRRRVTPIVEVQREASPAVVYILNEGRQTVGRDYFGQLIERDFSGTGSGVVIHKDGFIITNYHVVDGARSLVVRFDDQYDTKAYPAEVVSFVKEEDLALLKIKKDEHDFPTIPLGTSHDLMLGETVIAIGNPYGQTNTVSSGIISGLHRNMKIPTQFGNLAFDDLIQTDASINPGNSGGPLLNINGDLIGINNAMNPYAQGIGFAIPVDHVKKVLEERMLAADSAATWLGFDVIGGDHLQVDKVVPGSPAELAGLHAGDCIVAVGDTPVGTHEEYRLARVGLSPTRPVDFRVERAGQAKVVRLAPWDRYDGALYEHVGLKVKTIETALRSYVQVTEVRAGGPAAELGLMPNDIIDAVKPIVGARPRSWRVISRETFSNLITELEPGTKLQLDIYRDVNKDNRIGEEELHRGSLTIR